jgi:hypothetical protein
MNPKFWGPGGWTFLHSITMNYPKKPTEKDKKMYYHFFKNLEYVIPCEKCKVNYSRNLQTYPIEHALDTRESFIRWLIQIHNEVNKESGKRQYSYEEVIKEYTHKMSRLHLDETMVYKMIIIALLIIIIYKSC